jgi:hypothetical protein
MVYIILVQRHRACSFLSHLLQRQHPLNIHVLSHRYLNNCLNLYLRTNHNRISTHCWNLYCHLRIYIFRARHAYDISLQEAAHQGVSEGGSLLAC